MCHRYGLLHATDPKDQRNPCIAPSYLRERGRRLSCNTQPWWRLSYMTAYDSCNTQPWWRLFICDSCSSQPLYCTELMANQGEVRPQGFAEMQNPHPHKLQQPVQYKKAMANQ